MATTPLYTVLSKEATGEMAWTVNVKLDARHSIYRGHFPENPVLPGVCTIQIIKECLEEFMAGRFRYVRVSSCKFLSAVNPEHTPELQLNLSAKMQEDNQILLLADGKTGETEFIKLKATLTQK